MINHCALDVVPGELMHGWVLVAGSSLVSGAGGSGVLPLL